MMKLLAYLFALIAILGVLFVSFKPNPSPAPTTTLNPIVPTASPNAPAVAGEVKPGAATEASATLQPQAEPSAVETFAFIVRSGRLASGASVIRVREGDPVRLEFTTDSADELHVHGYDLHLITRPGEMVSLNFIAKRTGRFGLELHHAELELGALEVYPR